MNIRQKILAGYLVVFFASVIVGGFALHNIYRMRGSYEELLNYHVKMVQETQSLLLAFEYEALMMRTYLLTGLPEWKEEYRKQEDRTRSILNALETRIATEEERAVFAPLARSIRGFEQHYAAPQLAVREDPLLTEAQKMAQIRQLTLDYRGTVRGVITQGEDYIAYKQAILERTAAINSGWVGFLTVTTATLLGLTLVLGVGMAIYISRTIAAPLRALEAEARLLTAGDLTARELDVASRDEVGRLARSFARMSEQFRRLTEKVRAAADRVVKVSEALTVNAREASETAAANNQTLNTVVVRMNEVMASAAAVGRSVADASVRAEAVKDAAVKMYRQMEVSGQAATRAAQAVQGLVARLEDVGEVVRFSTELVVEAGRLAREAARETAYLYNPADGTRGRGAGCAAPEPLLALAAEMDRRSQFTSSAAAEIAGLVEDIRMAAEDAAAALDEEFRFVDQSKELALKVTESLAGIAEAVGLLSAHYREMAALSGQIFESVEAVGRSSATHGELVEQIGRAAADLEDAARELEGILAGLKV